MWKVFNARLPIPMACTSTTTCSWLTRPRALPLITKRFIYVNPNKPDSIPQIKEEIEDAQKGKSKRDVDESRNITEAGDFATNDHMHDTFGENQQEALPGETTQRHKPCVSRADETNPHPLNGPDTDPTLVRQQTKK